MKRLLMCLTVAFATACAQSALADVSVGVLIPLTGKGAAFGVQQQLSTKLFLEKFGDLGKAGKLKLVSYDTRGENADAINLTRKLVDSDQVVAIVGPLFSGEAEVVFPLAVRGQISIISPTAAKVGLAAPNRPWAFVNNSGTAAGDRAMIEKWLAAVGSIKKIVIFVDGKDGVSTSEGREVFPEIFKSKGIEVLDTISYQTGDIDYSAQVTRAKGLSPDGIIIAGLYNEAATLSREIRKQGLKQPIATGIGVMDPQFIQLAGPAAEGLFMANDYYRESDAPANKEFAAEFMKQLKSPPSNAAALIYDTLFLVRDCILDTGITGSSVASDRTKIQVCLTNTKSKQTPVMPSATTINANGQADRSPIVLTVKDGKFLTVR